jgi:hypothetical protein
MFYICDKRDKENLGFKFLIVVIEYFELINLVKKFSFVFEMEFSFNKMLFCLNKE